MNTTLSAWSLLAQYSRWKRLGDGLHRPGSRAELADLIPFFLTLAVVALVAIVAVQLYKRSDFSRPCDDPRKLFRQLCAAHQLNFSNRRLLLRLATALELPQPAALFVDPEAFATTNLPPQLRKEAKQISRLGQQLF
jgi:hypothetical protein